MIGQFKFLFTPLKIGQVVVPNRISFSAHMTNFAVNGLPSERHLYYWAERAKGGTGLIVTEEQSVHPSDHAYEKLIEAFDPAVVPIYRKITAAVHEYETKIFAQLNHNGGQSDGTVSRLPIWAPSPVADYLFREVPKAMEKDDIRELIEYFCRAATHVRQGGFDGIELQLGHASLIRQFLSPLTNLRQDEYGGSLNNRLRLAQEVIGAVRKTVGNDYTLGVRLCADEMAYAGLTLNDGKEIASRLEASGNLDFIDLTLATFYNLHLVGGSMHTPLGYAVPLSAGIKETVKLPVFCTGRINDPVMAERILAQGQADMIGMVRAQICDPELANKAKAGRLEEIRYCVADNQGCYGRMGQNKLLGCIQNPAIGYEKERGAGTLKPSPVKKKVLIVGGGPAGLRAAEVAAQRGHDVTLYEKKDKLGGQVNIAQFGAGRGELASIIRNAENQLKRLPVKVVLNREVDAAFVVAQKPAVVVIATGSVPKESPLPGIPGPNIFNLWQVLLGEAKLGEKILLLDNEGFHPSTATAEFLADKGKKVHMLCSAWSFGNDLGPTQDLVLTRQRLAKKGVVFTLEIAPIEVKGLELSAINSVSNEWLTFKGYDSIVLSLGNRVEDGLYLSLKDWLAKNNRPAGTQPFELYRIGDCVSPRRIDMAVLEGDKVGRAI